MHRRIFTGLKVVLAALSIVAKGNLDSTFESATPSIIKMFAQADSETQ